MEDKKNKYIILSMKCAGWLMLKGFVLLHIEKNNDNSGRNVFIFNETDELKEKLKEYKSLKESGLI